VAKFLKFHTAKNTDYNNYTVEEMMRILQRDMMWFMSFFEITRLDPRLYGMDETWGLIKGNYRAPVSAANAALLSCMYVLLCKFI